MKVANGSTLTILKKLDKEIMDKYKFAIITFQHDIYHTNYLNTRLVSRQIFENRGYLRVFSDVNNERYFPFEDWYIHPDLVDNELVNNLIKKNENKYKSKFITMKYFQESVVHKSIKWQDINLY